MWYLALVICPILAGSHQVCSTAVMPFTFANYTDCIHAGAANRNNSDKTGVAGSSCIKNDKGISVPSSGGYIQQFTPDGTNDLVSSLVAPATSAATKNAK